MADCPLNLAVGASARLSYGPNFTHEKLQLLEVDEELLQEIISTGVVIKGAPADEAVLCTASKTYVLKQVETSNTLLLIPPRVRADAGSRASAACSAFMTWHLTRRGGAGGRRRADGGCSGCGG